MQQRDEVDVLVARLIDALDDRAAEVFDERERAVEAGRRGGGLGLPLGSLALGVAATAVVSGALVAVVAIWLSIAVVNLAWARRRGG
jgi:hypothetical protein